LFQIDDRYKCVLLSFCFASLRFASSCFEREVVTSSETAALLRDLMTMLLAAGRSPSLVTAVQRTIPRVIRSAAVSRAHTVGRTTLTSWLLSLERTSACDAELTILLTCIASACQRISSLVARAPVDGMTGLASSANASGDEQKKLDVISNDVFVQAVRDSGRVSVLVSEEEDEPVALTATGKYVAAFDPIDGSSNIDAAIPTGSIFGIYSALDECKIDDSWSGEELAQRCLVNVQRSGRDLCASGYCLYSAF
jgi:hypothetical protein